MSKRQITYSDLTGGINNVDTKETLNSSPRKTETPDMVNVEYFGLGGIQTMKGNTQIGNTQSSQIVGGYEYIKGNKRYMMIATLNGEVKIYNEATNSYTTIFKFENKSDKVSFCNMNNGVVVSNGIDDLLFYEFGRNTELFGNVSIDEYSSNTLIGTETKFGTDIKVGDYITINNVNGKYKVEDIQNETTMTVTPNLDIKEGVEYYGFIGDKVNRVTTYPDNLEVIDYSNTIDNNYNKLKSTYIYNHNGVNIGLEEERTVILSGELDDEFYNSQTYGIEIYAGEFYIKENVLYSLNLGISKKVDDTKQWTYISKGEARGTGSRPYITIYYGIADNNIYTIRFGDTIEDVIITKINNNTYLRVPVSTYTNRGCTVLPVIRSDGTLWKIETTFDNNFNYTTSVTQIGTSKNWLNANSINQISSWAGSVYGSSSELKNMCFICDKNGNLHLFNGYSVVKTFNGYDITDVFGYYTTNSIVGGVYNSTLFAKSYLSFDGYESSHIYGFYINSDNNYILELFASSDNSGRFGTYSFRIGMENIIVNSGDDINANGNISLCLNAPLYNTLYIINNNEINNEKVSSIFGYASNIISEKDKRSFYVWICTEKNIYYFTFKATFRTNTQYINGVEFVSKEILSIKPYSYFTKTVDNDGSIISTENIEYNNLNSFMLDSLQINGYPLIGDTITNEYTITAEDIVRYTTDLVNANKVYSEANNTSYIDNIESINNYDDGTNVKLIYDIQISKNTKEQFIGTYNSNDNIINKDELPDTTNLQYYLSDVSELNAYLVNTDPDISSDENIHTPIRGTAIQYYNGRLWVGTDNGLFYSAVGLPNNWDIYSDAGVLYSIYNDSSKISALGIFSEYLTVHKQFSTYILTCTGDSSTIEVKPFSNITCESQQGWIVSNTKYFVFSKDFLDIYPLIQHTVWSDKFLGVPISQKIRNFFKKVRIGDTDKIFCVSRPRERQMLFYLPIEGFVGSNVAVIYDFQTNSWLMRQVPQNVTCAFQYNNKIYIGTDTGKVLEEFKSNTFDGVPIESYYKSPWFDWTGSYTQSFAEFVLEIDNEEDNNFFIDTQKDGQSRKETRNINSDKLYGKSMLWAYPVSQDDNNTDDMVWDKNNWLRATFETIRMLLPNNVFEDFQLKFFTNKIGQLFKIFKYGFRRIEADEAPW